MRTLRRALLALILAIVIVVAFAGAASAQASSSSSPPTLAGLLGDAQVLALIGGVLIPFVVAWLTRYAAPSWLKSTVAAVTAGLLALGTWLADANGAHTWRGALSVFVVALIAAASSRVTITGGLDTKLGLKTQTFGLTTLAQARAEKDARARAAAGAAKAA